jgi:dephospho-CoA kinase
LSSGDVDYRIAAQLSNADRRAVADLVIENNGSVEELSVVVHTLIAQLRSGIPLGKVSVSAHNP